MIKEPESIEECIYFSNRIIGEGKIKAWVLKRKCKKCNKGLMSKPIDEKTNKVKIRAKEYICKECKFSEDKEEYEGGLDVDIKYTCPYCKYEGETQIPFKRKKIQRINEVGKKESVEVLRFKCGKCSKDIDITKKMK